MPRRIDVSAADLNLPWITKEGYLDLTKLPMDSTLAQAVGEDMERFRSTCRLLGSMASVGRYTASVFLYGLLVAWRDDLTRKESIVEALGYVKTSQAAQLLFEELNRTESLNSTRGYINAVLKTLVKFPLECVDDGLKRLIADPKWSYRMKHKFRDVLKEIEYRNAREKRQ
jgi:hypothetical protein